MSDTISQHKGFAMGQTTPGYGHYERTAHGDHMARRKHHVSTAGHHNMDGHIGHGAHGHNHKSHGHHDGVVHSKTQGPGGVGEGGASTGKHQSGSSGPSDNQFGGAMPSGKGSSLGRW